MNEGAARHSINMPRSVLIQPATNHQPLTTAAKRLPIPHSPQSGASHQPLTTPNSPLRGTYSNFELRTQNSQLREALQFLTRRRAAPAPNPKPLT